MDENRKLNSGAMRPECVETMLFRKTMESIFKGICRDIDEGVMQECYGKLLGEHPSRISKVHSLFIKSSASDFKEKIDELITEENINEKFLQLQKLKEEASTEKLKWLPSRDCSIDIRSHDCQKLKQLKQELEVLVQKEEAEVEEMKIKVEDARKQCVNLKDKVSNLSDISSQLNSCTEKMEIHLERIISDMEPSHHIYK